MNARASSRAVALVGNAPSDLDRTAAIDSADRIVRLNNAHGFGGVTGARITDLVLINVGGQMAEWLADPVFPARPSVRDARRIVLPISPAKDRLLRGDGPRPDPKDSADHTDAARRLLAGHGRTVEMLPTAIFMAAAAIIGHPVLRPDMPAPSTGLLTLLWLLGEEPGPLDLYGFGFEGWEGHAWDRERAFARGLAGSGRIRLHPV